MRCGLCGRFMKLGGYYSNEHADSWEDTWTCRGPHGEKEPGSAIGQEGRNDG